MNNRFILILSVIVLSLSGCETSTEPEGKLAVYVVTRINRKPMDEFRNWERQQGYQEPDYPLQIILYDLVNYEGSVLFEKLGNKKISRKVYPYEHYFIIDTRGELKAELEVGIDGKVHSIEILCINFAALEITSSSIKGYYGFQSVTVTWLYEFEAIRI